MRKNKKPFNWGQYITFIGVIIICVIIFTDVIADIYVLAILGALCMAYGIMGLLRCLKTRDHSQLSRSMIQLILGAFVAFLGIVEGTGAELSQTLWNALLIVIVIILLLWLLLYFKKNRS